jgi:CheY-like chemotaxis protein
MIGAEADSGRRALELLRESSTTEPFQIAILDLMMPEMDGFELARAIKADSTISKIRLILLPSYGKRGDGKIAKEAGIAAYLQKPVRQSHLYDCLVSVISEPAFGKNEDRSKSLITRHSLINDTALTKAEPDAAASGIRVLVAEDNIVNQKVALNQLQSLGYSATIVTNGREAVETLKKSRYDIVLMDCQMPEMDGFEATTEIRRYEGDSNHTIIIAMTANA